MAQHFQLTQPSAVIRDQSSATSVARQAAISLFAIGMIGLGILALVYGDFALVWQPVAPWFPARTTLAYLSGVIMLACGFGLLFRPTAAWAARILFPYLIVWALLKVPALVVAPQIEGVWLGFGELAMLLAGGWTLFARLSPVREGSVLSFVTGESGVGIARMIFAVWVLPVGLSHFVYLPQTVHLVPAWLPFRNFWAYSTGMGHIAAGLGILFSIFPRVAATAEAAMIGVFTLFIWLPAIVFEPKNRMAWTAFFISWAIAAAAAVVAANIEPKQTASER
jgi:uncharacterized membrane protein